MIGEGEQDYKHIAGAKPISAQKRNLDVELEKKVQLPHDHV